MKKIVIIGLISYTNMGDPLLVDCIKYMIANKISNEKVQIKYADLQGRELSVQEDLKQHRSTVVMKAKKKAKHIIKRFIGPRGITKVKTQKIRREAKEYYTKAIQGADLVIISGAGTLRWHTRGNFEPYYDLISEYAQQLNAPCVINGIGVESKYSNSDYRSAQFSEVLSRDVFKIITTRDNLEELQKYVKNDKTKVFKIADAGVWAAETYNCAKQLNSSVIGLGVITYRRFEEFHRGISKEQYEKTIQEIIGCFNQKGIEWRMFTNGCQEDNEYAVYLNDKFNGIKPVLIPDTPKALVEAISQFKGVVASRLHSCIVAYSLDIPFVNICWNDKIKYFCETLGVPERCIEADRLKASVIMEELQRALQNGYDREQKNQYRQTAVDAIDEYLALIE